MIKWVKDQQPTKVLLVTECSMSDNVAVEAPDVEFVRPCNLCPHMKRITLENIYDGAARDDARGHRRSGRRRQCPPRRRAHGQPDELKTRSERLSPAASATDRVLRLAKQIKASNRVSTPPP